MRHTRPGRLTGHREQGQAAGCRSVESADVAARCSGRGCRRWPAGCRSVESADVAGLDWRRHQARLHRGHALRWRRGEIRHGRGFGERSAGVQRVKPFGARVRAGERPGGNSREGSHRQASWNAAQPRKSRGVTAPWRKRGIKTGWLGFERGGGRRRQKQGQRRIRARRGRLPWCCRWW